MAFAWIAPEGMDEILGQHLGRPGPFLEYHRCWGAARPGVMGVITGPDAVPEMLHTAGPIIVRAHDSARRVFKAGAVGIAHGQFNQHDDATRRCPDVGCPDC